MKLILPLLILIIFVGGGAGAGFFLRPAPEIVEEETATTEEEETEAEEEEIPDEDVAYVKLNNQFIVPIVKNDVVSAMVVLSITLETSTEYSDALYLKEPKIRDIFLRVLFDHAYGGGFEGSFVTSPSLDTLSQALLEAVHSEIGPDVQKVLITDIVRQDT